MKTFNNRFLTGEVLFKDQVSTLYKVYDKANDKKEALLNELTTPPETTQEYLAGLVARYRDSLLRANYHALAGIIDVFIDSGKVCVAYRWIEGENLESLYRVQNGQFFSWDVVSHMKKIALLLDKLHQQDPPLIHGNISPGNLTIRGQEKITLSGLAIPEVYMLTRSQHSGEHPLFTAPEVFEGRSTLASDIYSVCAVGYYLLTGKHPTQNPPFVFPDAELMKPEVSNEVSMILHRGLYFDPDKRYQTGQELADKLDAIAYTMTRKSQFTGQYLCPNCGVSLANQDKMCFNCNLDVEIFEGIEKPDVYYSLGCQHYQLGFFETAERYFYQAKKFGYAPPELYLYLARCHHKLGHPGSTEAILENLHEKNPRYIPYIIEHISILENGGKTAEAEKIKNFLEKNYKGNPRLLLYHADRQFARGECAEAEELLEYIIVASHGINEKIAAVELLAKILAKKGNLERLPSLVSKFPPKNLPPILSFYLALYYIQEKNWDMALAALTTAGKKDRLNWRIYYCMGFIQVQCQQWEKAIPLFLAAARYAPEPSVCLRIVAAVFRKTGRKTLDRIYAGYLGISDTTELVIEDTLPDIIMEIK